MRAEAERILEALSGGPFIFNLGHGVLPPTPLDNVAELCEMFLAGRGEFLMPRTAVVIYNLGGPDSPGRYSTFPVQSF